MSAVSLDAVDRGIPRRLSCRPDDLYFDQGLVARMTERVAVMLDDVELPEVTLWDVDAGEIVRRCFRDGRYLLDESGEPVFERLRGTVEVHWKTGCNPSPDRPDGSAARRA